VTNHVVATAGHVDHGKSTLVRALTGTDPDRWTEEKERGLTIDLGFAHTVLADDRHVSFVDVPGHTRFLKNMLAGVGAVDACLFVVAAPESWMPQSEEHLRILELLGIDRGLVAVTHAGAVDQDLLELALLDVGDRVAGTFLADAPLVAVDSIDGTGLDDLRAELGRLLDATPESRDVDRPRLWIDRSFAPAGAGTVVTGTLTGGAISEGQSLVVEPGGHEVRIRSLQSHFAAAGRLGPGTRAAVNLTGVDHHEIGRGHALVRADQWHRTTTLDASLTVLSSLTHDVSRRGAFVAYIGSGEHPVRLRVLGPDRIAPGATGAVRLFLPDPLPLLPGDRYVLRDMGRGETIGGGEILDVDPQLPAARAQPDRSVDRVVQERGRVTVDELERLTGERRTASLASWVTDPKAVTATAARLVATVGEAGPLGVDVAELDEWERAVLETVAELTVDQGRIRPAGATDHLVDHPFIALLEAAPFDPPAADDVDRAVLTELVRRGLVLVADGNWYAPSAVDAAAVVVADLLARQPDGVTVAEVRDALETSRKHALPLLSLLDQQGVTRRRDDVRIAGPRLPSSGSA
jgi:selenocysteine-specific elongation factor